MSDANFRELSPDRVVFFSVICREWIGRLRESLLIPPFDLLALALALEQTAQALRLESLEAIQPIDKPES